MNFIFDPNSANPILIFVFVLEGSQLLYWRDSSLSVAALAILCLRKRGDALVIEQDHVTGPGSCVEHLEGLFVLRLGKKRWE